MRQAALVMTISAVWLGWLGHAKADLIASHLGSTNPTTEGFTGNVNGAPLADDLGLPAWSVTSGSLGDQEAYFAPDFTQNQLDTIATQGFTLTMVARVLTNGMAPAYDLTNAVIGGVAVSYGSRRWDIYLGLDSNGDTVAVLPSQLFTYGDGHYVVAPGTTDILSSNIYHIYQLYYNPNTVNASLYIDGSLVVSSYAGHGDDVGTFALAWGALSGGQANFNEAQLETGFAIVSPAPEPSSLVIAGVGALGLLGYGYHRRRRNAALPAMEEAAATLSSSVTRV